VESSDRFASSSETTTLFGSSLASPQQAASLLRALAARHGSVVIPVAPVPLAGAVLAVEAWMEALGAESLDSPSVYGSSAQPALASALRLAATGEVPDACPHEELADFDRFATLLVRLDTWLGAWFPHRSDRADAVLFAAACLSCSQDPRLASLAELLDAWSEEL